MPPEDEPFGFPTFRVSKAVLCFSASQRTRAPSMPRLFEFRSKAFKALLTRTSNGQKCASENKFVSIGRMQTKQNSHRSRAAGGDTYDCGSESAMALAPPAPIRLSPRSRLVNALLIFGTIPFHEGKSGHKLVNIGRMQTKRISNGTKAAS